MDANTRQWIGFLLVGAAAALVGLLLPDEPLGGPLLALGVLTMAGSLVLLALAVVRAPRN